MFKLIGLPLIVSSISLKELQCRIPGASFSVQLVCGTLSRYVADGKC